MLALPCLALSLQIVAGVLLHVVAWQQHVTTSYTTYVRTTYHSPHSLSRRFSPPHARWENRIMAACAP